MNTDIKSQYLGAQNISNMNFPGEAASKGVFWIGNDGNVWVKGDRGTNSAGKVDSNSIQYWLNQGYDAIANPGNPNPGNKTPGDFGDQNTGTGGGGGTQYANTDAARARIQANLNALDGLLAAQNATARGEYDTLLNQYNTEDARAKQDYERQTQTNVDARSRGLQGAYTAATQGSRGLSGVLASIGALSGTGVDLANRAVAQAANTDIGNVNDNYTTNATNLNTAWTRTKEDQDRRRRAAETALKNARLKNAADIAKQRIDLYSQLGDKYADAGMFDQAKSTSAKIDPYYSIINKGAKVAAPNFSAMKASFDPAALENYLAGGYNQNVSTRGGGAGSNLPANTPLYVQSRKKDKALA